MDFDNAIQKVNHAFLSVANAFFLAIWNRMEVIKVFRPIRIGQRSISAARGPLNNITISSVKSSTTILYGLIIVVLGLLPFKSSTALPMRPLAELAGILSFEEVFGKFDTKIVPTLGDLTTKTIKPASFGFDWFSGFRLARGLKWPLHLVNHAVLILTGLHSV
jgi:hypothetical protein